MNDVITNKTTTKRKSLLTRLRSMVRSLFNIEISIGEIKVNQGVILAELNRSKESKNIQNYEFKVFSQWGEDGIIQKLIDSVDIENKTFIEFGVEDFSESNCRFLMFKDNWSGFIIDSSGKNIERANNSYWNWRHDLQVCCSFVTRDNINDLMALSGFEPDAGILSIDIDGVDYFILESLTILRPRILIMEYNSTFGAVRPITVPYDETFDRSSKHFSNLYFGASLAALTYLAEKKGYSLVGTNSAGINAFFVRNDLMSHKLKRMNAEEAFTVSKVRESRAQSGQLSLARGAAKLELIKGLPVLNVVTGEVEEI